MFFSGTTPRRGFLGRVAAVAVATTIPWSRVNATPARLAGPDDWLDGMTGAHRCLFDFPVHKNGFPLIHMLNYITTYEAAYKVGHDQVNAVGTLYSVGPASSIPFAFNDSIWEKYQLGSYVGLTDPKTGAGSTRNMLFRPMSGDPVLFNGAAAAAGIESLQSMGATFLLCNNALMAWVGELSGLGKGTPAQIEEDLRANILPGVHTVPAMVIAIDKAQAAGISYNKQ